MPLAGPVAMSRKARRLQYSIDGYARNGSARASLPRVSVRKDRFEYCPAEMRRHQETTDEALTGIASLTTLDTSLAIGRARAVVLTRVRPGCLSGTRISSRLDSLPSLLYPADRSAPTMRSASCLRSAR